MHESTHESVRNPWPTHRNKGVPRSWGKGALAPFSPSPTCKGEADELHALLAHDRPAEAAVVAAVTDAELIPTVWAERDILVIDPRHHGLFYCCGKKTKSKQQRESIIKRDLEKEKEKE